MAAGRKSIHLICNAHLDPVWLWEWQEGAAEALSTFRTAADLCEQNDTFIFNHNEVTLYKWVAEYEPTLFKRIQKLVKQGKWHIMGGWYLQPDCNMPSGESFVRQILLGRNYFKKHFGVQPTTAINFDPFGHTQGLVQILAKSGYDSYLFGRPSPQDIKLPAEEFIWTGFDGSEITATRFTGWYNTPLGKAKETISKRIEENKDKMILALLWGVGNHGGGPSKVDLRNINRFIKKTNQFDIRHSTPDAYFKQLRRCKDKLPKYNGDLNPWAVGCYTSQIRIKQGMRRLENEIFATEKMAAAAAVQNLMRYPYDKIHESLCDLANSQFHDILPGSSIEPAEQTALEMLGHGLETIARVKARAFFALAAGQPKPKDGQIPIMVYNQHPFTVTGQVECEFNLPDFKTRETFTKVLVYQNGKPVPCQVEQESSNIPSEWRKRIVFLAELKPGQMNRFDCRLETLAKKPSAELKTRNNKIRFKTKDVDVTINTRTGFIDRYRVRGIDHLKPKAFQPLVIADNEDPWGMTTNGFRKVVGRFKLMSRKAGTEFSGIKDHTIESVRIIEDGPVRSVVEAVFSYGNSFICQRYKLPRSGTEIEVEITVHWNEKDKMLKLSIPTMSQDNKYLGQVAYGRAELPNNGDQAVAQKWVAVVSRKENTAFTCINDGIYSSDFSRNGLRLTLLRSPAYSAHPDDDGIIHMPTDRYSPRIDQGQRHFRLWFNGGKVRQRLDLIDREALTKNQTPLALSFFPPGGSKKPKPLAVLNDNVVQITAIKRAESNNDLVIRLFEPTGRKRTTQLALPCLNKKITITLNPFEIRTLRISPKTGKYTTTNLLENKISR